ncbi:helix-turn-helix transcriptional regulator [Nocardia paucivorans]|uniref:helix-turn-helix transcriptional regulator n=1 Tax=Nocardia paucivorans TaxID=114259 RepID=UPI0002E007C2|nr:helix-turn-helix transcriptional regulator [Nocardia paucivorans]
MDKHALADFLRRRRARLSPGAVGLTPEPGQRRRTPGLRREEVAWLAGISTNYYERLEQARAPRPSPQVLAALARVLQLGQDEQRYMTGLAGHELGQPGLPHEDVPAGVRRLLERIDMPAYVLNPRYDVLAWNPPAVELIGDFAAERNLLRLAFGTRALGVSCGSVDGERHFIRQAVADLRGAAVRYPDDPEIPRLIDWLSARDTDFRNGWEAHEVAPEPSMGKRFEHPVVGVIELDAQTLSVPGRDQRLVVYSAEPGSRAAEAIRELSHLHVAAPEDSWDALDSMVRETSRQSSR